MNDIRILNSEACRDLFEFPTAVPANMRKRGAALRHIGGLGLDHRFVSIVSLGVTYGVQRCVFGQITAMGVCFILLAHEAGHLAAARWFNIAALWPVFIPKVGALILLKDAVGDPRQEAWIAMAGPFAGMSATGIIHFFAVATGSQELALSAAGGYAMHLFNFIPLGDTDGGRVAPLVGRWLWIAGFLINLGLLVLFRHLPWPVVLLALFLLLGGCLKIRRWLVSRQCKVDRTPGYPASTKIGIAALYCAAVALSILGLLASGSTSASMAPHCWKADAVDGANASNKAGSAQRATDRKISEKPDAEQKVPPTTDPGIPPEFYR